jgi:hypothetical protein
MKTNKIAKSRRYSPNPKGREGDKVSLSPLKPEEVMSDLFKVKPEAKKEGEKRKAKKR